MADDLSKSEAGGDQVLSEITLRPMVLSDIDDFMVWTTDDRASQFCTWNTFTSKEQALDIFKRKAVSHPWFRVICIDNRAIGSISVTPNTGIGMCRAELGYVLGYKYWGKGIATRAVKMVASTIFGELPQLERLEALVVVENKGSQRVLEKAGFQMEARTSPSENINMAENTLKSNAGGEGHQEFSKITLRPIELSDMDDFMVWATDDRVSRYCIWDTYTSKDQASDFFKNNAMPHPWFRVICTDNRAIGSISVSPNSGNNRCRAELGYVLAYEHWGKGIATKAVKMVASTIFHEWPHLERLEGFVDADNRGSQRVLEKAGFEREGVLRKHIIMKGKSRDMVVFSLLSSDQHFD
ncbi:hypothetical protein Pfo_026252 [Paulownia fortunei]|nr:hypothetical protein Pfo_026252 [Paulownia fortunei]